MTLHEELRRIAADAPVAAVPEDTWTLGRRARARERVLVLAAAAAVVGLVAGLAAWLPVRFEPPVADTDSLGVPDRLYAIPDDVSLDASSDLAVGLAAAAWQEYTQIVVVGADGRYHLLEPEGYDDVFMSGGTVALSPDGTHLAYTWSDLGSDAGLRVADLETGDVRTIALGDDPVGVEHLAWSANGLWLAWNGTTINWTDGGYSGAGPVAGRVPLGSSTSEDVGAVPNDANLALAVSPGGTVLFVTTNELVQARPGYRDRVPHTSGELSSTGVVDPETGLLGVGAGGLGSNTLATVVDPATGDLERLAGTEDRVQTSPLGYIGADLLIGVTVIGADGVHSARRLELVGPDHEPRVVSELDDLVPYDLTVATDLMTPEQPTVHHPEPDWPNSTLRTYLLFGTIGALGILTSWLLRRRR